MIINIASILSFLLPWKTSQFARAVIYSVINKIVLILPEFFLGLAINVVLHSAHESVWGITNPMQQLLFLIGMATLLWVIASIFHYLEGITWQRYAHETQHNIRIKMYNTLQELQYNNQLDTGNVVSIINDDINQIESCFRFAANDIIHLIVGTIIIGITYFYYAPLIALIALLPIPLIMYASWYFQKKLQVHYLITRNQAGRLAGHITDVLHNRTFDPLNLEKDSLNYHNYALEAAHINSLINPIINNLIAFSCMVTIAVSGYYVFHGHLLTGTFSIIVLQTQRLLWPFARTAQIIDSFERTAASLLRIETLIKSQEALNSSYNNKPSQQPDQKEI